MSVAEGDAAFVDESYGEAVAHYTAALAASPLQPAALLVKRAAAHLKLHAFADAAADASRCATWGGV